MVQSLSRFTTPIALAIVLYIGACSPASPPGSAGEARGILTLGLLPDENAWIQQVAHGPLADAIRTKTGYEVRFVTAASYNDLVEKFSRGEIDAAYFGGYTFLLAEERSGAVPLVMRDIDVDFVSYILVRRDMRAHKLNDLVGRSFAFGSQFSTSGHIMPRHFLRERGIDPERFFSSVEYSGAHDRTIQWVLHGRVDAGVTNGQILKRLLNDGDIDPKSIRVIWQSPRYVDYVWAVQPTMTNKTQRLIKEVFLSLATDKPEHRRFLEYVGADYYIPAAKGDFDELRDAVRQVGAIPQIATDSARAE